MEKAISKAKKGGCQRGRFSKKSEPEFFYASRNKNLDNMKLLLSFTEVKEIIIETRNHIRIPKNGLGDEQSEQWHKKDDIRCDEIMNTPDFIKKELGIKKSWREKKIMPDEARKQLHELYLQVPVNYLFAQIWKIIRQFNVPENYEHHIYLYILYGKITAPVANYHIGPFQVGERLRDVRRVPITIYAKLTDKDLHDLKLSVNRHFGNRRLPFIQDTKNVEKNLEIEKMFYEKQYDYAMRKEYKLTAGDIAEGNFGNKRKKSKVYDAVSGLRKLRKRRFGKQ